MEAIEELVQLSDAMLQASAVLADEDIDESSSSSSRRTSTFLNAVALGNVVSIFPLLAHSYLRSWYCCWFGSLDLWVANEGFICGVGALCSRYCMVND